MSMAQKMQQYTNHSKVTRADANGIKDARVDTNHSKFTRGDVDGTKDASVDTNHSKVIRADVNGTKDTNVDTNHSKVTRADVNGTKDTNVDTNDSKTPTWTPYCAHSDFGEYVLNQLHPNYKRDPRTRNRLQFSSMDSARELCVSMKEMEHLDSKPQRKLKKKDFLFVQQRPGHRHPMENMPAVEKD
ncbi:hypothetical protein PoB_007351600 [Plakobranchus ocellatus]|uniref:Uncharacterized protein n=1 Tax=Plakobranchus ocellatus TaxID=259542 RepID=A0AAV4DT60_9GAST|nr:hypothetical protein PoB_007351600 [Plakobranchus ocellatus]